MVPTDELESYPRRPRWWRILIPAVLVGVVAALFVIPAEKDDEVPDFSLPLLSGEGKLTSDELRGSPVVLNFFASWCVPCREEAPLLQKAYEDYREEGVRFVGVATNDLPDRALDFADDFGITYDIVQGNDELERGLGINGLPQTLFVNQDWELTSVEANEKVGAQGSTTVLGAISGAELRKQIEALLED
jgi:cytochrome c biogenesis protein CcmG, thiol:disulfide interchange protein DsbE